MSRKSRRPVQSISSAEIIPAAIAIDEGKILIEAIDTLLSTESSLAVCVDSKDFWDSLSSCHEPIDKAVKDDVKIIRY